MSKSKNKSKPRFKIKLDPKPKGKRKLFERQGNLIIMDRRNLEDFMGECAFCKKHEELRPYGPNYEEICHDCALKNPAETEKKMYEFMFQSHN